MMMGLSQQEIDSDLCRLCGSSEGLRINIFDDKSDYQAKIHALLPIAVYEYDPLPHKMCHRCAFKLDSFYEFKDICVKTESQLKQRLSWIPNNNNKPNISSSAKSMVHLNEGALGEFGSFPMCEVVIEKDKEEDEDVQILSDSDCSIVEAKENRTPPCEQDTPKGKSQSPVQNSKTITSEEKKKKPSRQQQVLQQQGQDSATAEARPKTTVTQSPVLLKSLVDGVTQPAQEVAPPSRAEYSVGRKRTPPPNGSCPSGCRQRGPTSRSRPDKPNPATGGEGSSVTMNGRRGDSKIAETTSPAQSTNGANHRPGILLTRVPGVCEIFTCESCERMFTTRETAYSHVCESGAERGGARAESNSDPSYDCSICGQNFARHATLEAHMRGHSHVWSDSDSDNEAAAGRRRKPGRKQSGPRKFVRLSDPPLPTVAFV